MSLVVAVPPEALVEMHCCTADSGVVWAADGSGWQSLRATNWNEELYQPVASRYLPAYGSNDLQGPHVFGLPVDASNEQ